MESQKVDMFLMTNSKFFSPEKIMFVKAQLEKLDDSKFINIQSVPFKDPMTMLLVSLFGGHLGIDRFMLGEVGLGILKLITCGGFGIWTIVDWFTIMNKTRDQNIQKLNEALAYS